MNPELLKSILEFFNAPVLLWVGVILLMDTVTGIPRALAEHRFSWTKLPLAFFKAYYYLAIFIALRAFFHGIGIPLIDHLDVFSMWVIVLKEVISVLQNAKGYATATGNPNPMVDVIIDFLRLNIFHLVLERIPGGNAEEQKKQEDHIATELAKDDEAAL